MAGLGYFMQSISSIKNELKQKDISIFPLKGLPLIENWRLIWLKQKKMPEAAKAFLNLSKTINNPFIKNSFPGLSNMINRLLSSNE